MIHNLFRLTIYTYLVRTKLLIHIHFHEVRLHGGEKYPAKSNSKKKKKNSEFKK